MVDEASGCWASEVSAVATALPSAIAGIMHPNPVVNPATMIDVTAVIVMLSMNFPSIQFVEVESCFRLVVCVAAAMYTAARILKMYA